MSFYSPNSSSPASRRGYLGEASNAKDSRTASEGGDTDGTDRGHASIEPLSARKGRSKGPGFLLESDPGQARQSHRSFSLFSSIPNLVRRDHKRRRQHGDAGGDVDRAGSKGLSSQKQPPRLGAVPVSQGTPDSMVIQRGPEPGATERDPDVMSPIGREEVNGAVDLSQESNQAQQIGYGDGGHQSDLPASRTDLDTESVRWINLALNLNEARRRSVHLGGTPPRLGANERRSVSMIKPTQRWDSMDGVALHGAGGSDVRDQLGQGRRTSRYASSPANATHHSRGRRDENSSGNERSSTTTKFLSSDEQQAPDRLFSKATLARVAKAKAAFELAAEYRRLLQYLPPLRPETRLDTSAQSSTLSSPTEPTSQSSSSGANSLSSVNKREERSYNPLQCRRNRRFRLEQRQTPDSAVEDWGDVTQVKEWVNKVEKQSTEAPFRDAHRRDLPPFTSAQLESKHGQSASVTSLTQGVDNAVPGRRSKPRIDWHVSSEELFADAYWLEQDDHKGLIQDKDGNKIFRPKTPVEPLGRHESRRFDRLRQLRKDFSGRNSLDTVNGSTKNAPTSSSPGSRAHSLMREKYRRIHRHGVQGGEVEPKKESQRKRARRYTGGDRSLSSSDSDDSRQGPLGRKRSRHHKQTSSIEELDNAVLEKQMLAMLEKEAEEMESQQSNKPEAAPYRITDGQKQLGHHSAHPNIMDRPDNQKKIGYQRSHMPQNHESPASVKSESANLSTDELNTTATNSPQGNTIRHSTESARGLVPSLALNQSRPQTRHASPERGPQGLKKGLERHDIEANDFATANGQSTTLKEGLHLVDSASSSPERQKKFNRAKMFGSRRIAENETADDGPSNIKIRPIKKDRRHPDQSRIRGLFGGVRIEEIFRNEVSRLGGFLWKRDTPPDASASSLPTSRRNSEQLDEKRQGVRKRPTNGTTSSRASTDNERLSQVTTNHVPPNYKLPTFIPLSGMNGAAQAPRPSVESDHSNTRHGVRNDRATTSTKPSNKAETRNSEVSRLSSRRNSYGVRGRSKSPSQLATKGVRGADSRLKSSLAVAGSDDAVAKMTTFDSSSQGDNSRQVVDEVYRLWNISDHETPSVQGRWSVHEIERLRVLLLSSGVKAQGIVEHAKRMKTLQLSALDVESDMKSLNVRNNERHKIAAQLLNHAIDHHTAILKESTKRLNTTVVPGLLKEMSNIQHGLSSKLTKQVRGYIDEADTRTELTTTHILTVKQLSDSIDLLIRRRRRRFRWIRRGGYVLLEWTLLGMMWWVWLIVVIIRLFRAAVAGFSTGLRWLFWL
ncbi:MAG: hypothetical protein M1816_001337 [Peltula sp. TS41687]|nr:MAG: hypothetical protein M1816_001337 [Peltula sp. TS41687]